MNISYICSVRAYAVSFLIVISMTWMCYSQQKADLAFDTKVARPAYTTSHPKVLFDEAHYNFHKSGGRYKPFADLITNDGYQVTPNKEKFQTQTLAGYDILVIANALGDPDLDSPKSANPAFTELECDAVRDWVQAGGELLLIADHAPTGSAAANLAARFGVEMSNAYTVDPINFLRASLDATWIEYSRQTKSLADHPITRGRDASERLTRVVTFTGQSLKGPKGSTAILKLSDKACDVFDYDTPERAKCVPAAGRAQAVVMSFGKGRVAVFGEAAMLTAQNKNFGMNYPGIDNRQLALNVMHWLSGLLK